MAHDPPSPARWSDLLLAVAAIAPVGGAWATLLGIGLHRHAAPAVVVLASGAVLFAPPAAVALAARTARARHFLAMALAWSALWLALFPVWFPGERREALATGLSVLRLGEGWDRVARQVADQLPAEPSLATPEPPVAAPVVAAPLPPGPALEAHQIALPFEGEGRRLAVPVVFEHGGREEEVWMMLDTGATYTTLPGEALARLGLTPGADAPVLTLHTANGDRDAAFVVADRVWLGDLAVDGVAVARCDACANGEIAGLLGLNVSGGYNLTIDSDRQEVVFSAREAVDRRLDASPFVKVAARFSRFPGGRVEVEVSVRSVAPRRLPLARVEVRCAEGEGSWQVEVYDVPPGGERTALHRLPEHARCEGYLVQLVGAEW